MSAPDPERGALYDRGVNAFRATLATLDPTRFRAWLELGLTITQLRALAAIRSTPGITVTELAERFEVTPPSITGLIDRLVAQNYIAREGDNSDRRRVRHFLTPYAVSCLARISNDTEQHFARVFDQMTDEELFAFTRGHEAFVSAHQAIHGQAPELDVEWEIAR